jgi:hypothetical protein
MKNAGIFTVVFLLISLTVLACGSPAPGESAPSVEAPASAEPGLDTEAATPTTVPTSLPTPTTAKLQLEVVQSQAWTDPDGNVRANFLLRNPYDFPVEPGFRARASLFDGAGEFIRDDDLYFLDGISGGHGFVLPGETVAANACFNCEEAPLTEEWKSVEFASDLEDATGKWDFYTEVEASVGSVSFEGDSPIFWVNGTVKNNSDSMLQRISARVFVFDQEGHLVGAAEVSAWDVAAGATASFDGYGIGQKPAGSVTYEVTALGVKY